MSAPMKPMPKTFWDFSENCFPLIAADAERWASLVLPIGASVLSQDHIPEIELERQSNIFQAELDLNGYGLDGKDQYLERAQMLFETKQEQLCTLANFCRHGKKTFFLSEGLTERLYRTDLNIPSKMVSAPFPSCMFVFDDPITRSLLNEDKTPEEIDLVTPLSVFITTLPNSVGRTMALRFYRRNSKRMSVGGVELNLDLNDNEMLEESLWKSMYKDFPVPEAVKLGLALSPHDEVRVGRSHKLARIVVNAVLYLSSRHPEISGKLWAVDRVPRLPENSSPKKKRGHAGYLKSLSHHPYVEVGPSIGRLEHDLPPEASSPSVRFMVRGHWRNQAHGEGHSLRRFQWIQPHWKGEEMAEIVSKQYRVDGGK